MSIKLSLGNKKKSFNSIREAARKVAEKTGEPENRVYMRLYMRKRNGWKISTAVNKAPRPYTITQATA